MISVIIPVYNEEEYLPETLNQLLLQDGQYEVIVVDGGSTDRTLELASAHTQPRLISAHKGRAAQMNAGAGIATGEWLLFLHADTVLPQHALTCLNGMECDFRIQAGGFHQQFTGNDWRLRLVSWLHNFRCSRTRVIYGDQAMFVRNRLFRQLGGFPNCQILEDIKFSEKLLKSTEPVLMDQCVTTNARKFMRMGIWRSLGRIIGILLCYELRLPILPMRFFQDIR